MTGHGIRRRSTGYLIIAQPGTSREEWQTALDWMRSQVAEARSHGHQAADPADYEICPVTFSGRVAKIAIDTVAVS